MNKEDICDTTRRIIKLICSITGAAPEDISLESTVDDIKGWDSLSHIQIVCAVEKSINRKLTLDEMISLQSVKDLVKIVNA